MKNDRNRQTHYISAGYFYLYFCNNYKYSWIAVVLICSKTTCRKGTAHFLIPAGQQSRWLRMYRWSPAEPTRWRTDTYTQVTQRGDQVWQRKIFFFENYSPLLLQNCLAINRHHLYDMNDACLLVITSCDFIIAFVKDLFKLIIMTEKLLLVLAKWIYRSINKREFLFGYLSSNSNNHGPVLFLIVRLLYFLTKHG